MVLINNLTIDEINAALIRLQRMQTEVVGGEKGTTINNVTVNSESSGGGYTTDYSGLLKRISTRLDSAEKSISSNAKDIGKQETKNKEQQQQIEELQALFDGLTSMQITQFSFDEATRTLYLVTSDMAYEVPIPSETVTLSLNTTTNKLTFTMGSQTQEVTLPYINSSEKGSANGVATLDSSGRVPYSQLPESAMEFLGQWDASTNTPHLADGTGTNGDFYVCNVGGTVTFGTGNTQTFVPNDRVIYNGSSSQWIKLPAGQVSSVNGMSGDVTLTASDIDYSTGVTIKDKIDANAVQANWNEADNTSLAFIKNKPSLATVATSGSYTDLVNKPTIPAAQVQSNWTETNSSSKAFIKNKPTLATVATSGSYNDLSNKPTIPAAQIQSDWTQTDSTKKDFIKNKIPIWITNGSADDNMSPVNVVEAGNTRPVTSGGVASAVLPFSKRAIGATQTTSTYPYYYIRFYDIPTNNTSATDTPTFIIGTRYNRYLMMINPWFTTGDRFQIVSLTGNDTRGVRIVDCAWFMSSTTEAGTMECWIKLRCNGTASGFSVLDISKMLSTLKIQFVGNDSASYGGTTASAYFNNIADKGTLRLLDTTPTLNSVNLITSGGVYSKISSSTPSFDCPRGGTYTLNFLIKQQIGDVALYMGRVTLGTDASGGSLYINVDGLRGSTHNICNSQWCISGTSFEGTVFSAYGSGNTSLRLRIGSTSTDLQTSEGAGQSIDFSFMAIPYSA